MSRASWAVRWWGEHVVQCRVMSNMAPVKLCSMLYALLIVHGWLGVCGVCVWGDMSHTAGPTGSIRTLSWLCCQQIPHMLGGCTMHLIACAARASDPSRLSTQTSHCCRMRCCTIQRMHLKPLAAAPWLQQPSARGLIAVQNHTASQPAAFYALKWVAHGRDSCRLTFASSSKPGDSSPTRALAA